MPHDFTPVQESIVTPLVYNPDATIVVRGKYDHNKSAYIPEQVTAYQASEALTAAEYLDKSLSALKSSVQDVREYLIEALQDGSIDEDVATEIAQRLGFELSNTYKVEVVIRYTATISVPLGDEPPSEYDFEARIDYNGSGDVEDEDCETDGFSCDDAY